MTKDLTTQLNEVVEEAENTLSDDSGDLVAMHNLAQHLTSNLKLALAALREANNRTRRTEATIQETAQALAATEHAIARRQPSIATQAWAGRQMLDAAEKLNRLIV